MKLYFLFCRECWWEHERTHSIAKSSSCQRGSKSKPLYVALWENNSRWISILAVSLCTTRSHLRTPQKLRNYLLSWISNICILFLQKHKRILKVILFFYQGLEASNSESVCKYVWEWKLIRNTFINDILSRAFSRWLVFICLCVQLEKLPPS